MCSVNIEEDDWIDDLEETDNEQIRIEMGNLERKRISGNLLCRSPLVKQKPPGLVESMMKCVIADSTLDLGRKSYQMALTPRTERRYQAPLLTGRRVHSFRASVPSSPMSSPRRRRAPSSPLSSPRIYRTTYNTPVR